jgi:hypothetical protein
MNRLIVLMIAAFVVAQSGLVWAGPQTAAVKSPGTVPNAGSSQTVFQRSHFNHQVRDLKLKIKLDLKNGKISKNQAADYLRQIKDVHRQALLSIKQNPGNSLTSDQENQFDQQLAGIKSSL